MPVPGILGGYLETGQALANIDLTNQQIRDGQMLSKQRAFALDRAQKNADIEDATRKEMQDAAAEAMRRGGIPQEQPNGQPTPMSQTFEQEARQADDMVKRMARAGNVDAVNDWTKRRTDAQQKAQQARHQELQDAQKQYADINNIVSGIEDQNTLDKAVEVVRAKYGNRVPMQQIAQLLGAEVNPMTGGLTYGPEVKKNAEAIGKVAVTEAQRAANEQRELSRVIAKQNADEKARHNQETEAARRREEQRQREMDEYRKEQDKDKKEAKKQAEAKKVEEEGQRTLNRDPVYSKFSQYQAANDLAQDVARQLRDPNGYKDVSPADMRALATAYSNMSEGFRARTGGKYALQDMDKFNGLWQKLHKYTTTLGKGTPTFDESTAKEVSNTISELYTIANKNALIASYEAMDRVARRKGNPEAIQVKGDLNQLSQRGMAWKETVNGKDYLVIGRKGGQQARFEITPAGDE